MSPTDLIYHNDCGSNPKNHWDATIASYYFVYYLIDLITFNILLIETRITDLRYFVNKKTFLIQNSGTFVNFWRGFRRRCKGQKIFCPLQRHYIARDMWSKQATTTTGLLTGGTQIINISKI